MPEPSGGTWSGAAGAVAGLLAAAVAWSAGSAPVSQPARPSIILVTLDTTRADHLGCYGYPRATSRFIDSLARQGVLFTRAFAAMSTTAPSHASLFTALYPLQHNVQRNGDVLDGRVLTLAEWLRARGYDTAAFVSTHTHFKNAGFGQGFDAFDEPPPSSGKYRVGSQTVAEAVRWLDLRRSTRPLFLWVHLFDAHTPYNQAHRFPAASKEAGRRWIRFLTEAHHIDLGFFGGDPQRLLDLMAQYDGEVRATDQAVQRLFDRLRARPGESLWIITSDHGEGLGNHRWLKHAPMLYNEQIRVALVLYSTAGAFAGRQIDCVVENVDVFPTIADLLGEPLGGQIPAVAGRSFRPLLSANDCAAGKRYAFAERREFDPESDRDSPKFERGEKYTLQDARYKYVLRTQGPHELYDLERDPYETTNLLGQGRPQERELARLLTARVVGLKRQALPPPQTVDPATAERLRALGYER